jgi:hypothetical protein
MRAMTFSLTETWWADYEMSSEQLQVAGARSS